ncbi:hypothetical protein [Brassicibacter mesophilus]|uniref:hypothetical protein n=1 Tax=Brassicibacter mesophilus TaxID=745119 RepID=UPI003D1C7703
MSETRAEYKTSNENLSKEVLWLSKRLKDLAIDFNKLSEEEQSAVIARASELDPVSVVSFCNIFSSELNID